MSNDTAGFFSRDRVDQSSVARVLISKSNLPANLVPAVCRFARHHGDRQLLFPVNKIPENICTVISTKDPPVESPMRPTGLSRTTTSPWNYIPGMEWFPADRCSWVKPLPRLCCHAVQEMNERFAPVTGSNIPEWHMPGSRAVLMSMGTILPPVPPACRPALSSDDSQRYFPRIVEVPTMISVEDITPAKSGSVADLTIPCIHRRMWCSSAQKRNIYPRSLLRGEVLCLEAWSIPVAFSQYWRNRYRSCDIRTSWFRGALLYVMPVPVSRNVQRERSPLRGSSHDSLAARHLSVELVLLPGLFRSRPPIAGARSSSTTRRNAVMGPRFPGIDISLVTTIPKEVPPELLRS